MSNADNVILIIALHNCVERTPCLSQTLSFACRKYYAYRQAEFINYIDLDIYLVVFVQMVEYII